MIQYINNNDVEMANPVIEAINVRPVDDNAQTMHDEENIAEILNQNDERIEIQIFIKLIAIVITVVLCSPIIICDIYFAVNDNTCVNNDVKNIDLTLKDYLMVSGIYNLFMLIFCIFSIIIKLKIDCIEGIKILDNLNLNIFNEIWNIVGAILFWGLMNTDECSRTTYNYVYATLIIKLISMICTSMIRVQNINGET
jgi:hypothetical protein